MLPETARRTNHLFPRLVLDSFSARTSEGLRSWAHRSDSRYGVRFGLLDLSLRLRLDHLSAMQRQPLKSSALRSAGYDPDRHELEVEFRNRRVYRYRAVPKSVFEWLCRSRNKGGYLSRVIDRNYESTEVTPFGPEPDLVAALKASLRDE